MNIPRDILEIANKLSKPIYLVGGCVRDHVMDREPKDYDLCTELSPSQVCRQLPGAKMVNAVQAYPVVVYGGYEIATFRTDADRTDCSAINTTNVSLEQDSARRDFTVNALYMNVKTKELIDPQNGLVDIQDNVLRFVGDPERRINEDPLRIFRAFRFASRLKFEIAPDSEKAIKILSGIAKYVSMDRFIMELHKEFSLDFLKYLERYELDTWYFARNADFKDFSAVKAIDRRNSLNVNYNILITQGYLKSEDLDLFRLPNELLKVIRKTQELIKFLLEDYYAEKRALRRRHLLNPYLSDALLVVDRQVKLDIYDEEFLSYWKQIHGQATPGEALRELGLSGNDLIAAGYKGKAIGEKLKELEDALLLSPGVDIDYLWECFN